jgi:VCBS repeat-containing protein
VRAKDERGPFIRSLEEGTEHRHYLTAQDPDDGRRYLWEAVEHQGKLVAIRQLEIDLEGGRWRYDWKHLEDESGFLTEGPLHLDKSILAVTRDVFLAEWEA